MKKILVILFVLLLNTWGQATEKKFKVSGSIRYTKHKGTIYVKLFTRQEFNQKGEPEFAQTITINKDNQKAVSFEFKNVPEGIYAIKCFQDLNGNGKIDMGFFGPKEPYGLFRKKGNIYRRPQFNDLSFILIEIWIMLKSLLINFKG